MLSDRRQTKFTVDKLMLMQPVATVCACAHLLMHLSTKAWLGRSHGRHALSCVSIQHTRWRTMIRYFLKIRKKIVTKKSINRPTWPLKWEKDREEKEERRPEIAVQRTLRDIGWSLGWPWPTRSMLSKAKKVAALVSVVNLTAVFLSKLAVDILIFVHEAGYQVIGISSDNKRVNRNMFTMLCDVVVKPHIAQRTSFWSFT